MIIFFLALELEIELSVAEPTAIGPMRGKRAKSLTAGGGDFGKATNINPPNYRHASSILAWSISSPANRPDVNEPYRSSTGRLSS